MNDLASERELARLAALYAEQSDAELLDLHDRRDDLTEVAQQALTQTMRGRKLEPRPPAELSPAFHADEATEAGAGEVFVYRFQDSLRAVAAANILEYAGISHRLAVHPSQVPQSGATVTLFVANEDELDARNLLQRKMHLFPDELYEAHVEIDGPMVLGEFTREQAAIVTKALEEKGVPFETGDGDRDGAPVLLSVPAERLDEAFALMEEIAGQLPPDPDEPEGA